VEERYSEAMCTARLFKARDSWSHARTMIQSRAVRRACLQAEHQRMGAEVVRRGSSLETAITLEVACVTVTGTSSER
jgi:hypothetical protein